MGSRDVAGISGLQSGKNKVGRRPDFASPKVCGRSKITNGRLLPDIYLRNAWVRRFKDLLNLHLSDLGGPDSVSEAENSIVRRATTITVELEQMERKFALKGGSDQRSARGLWPGPRRR